MEETVRKRGVRYAWHFTRLENLPSILKHGLVPRSMHENGFEDAIHNDELRLDGYPNASCVSIGHPNYKMFYSYRMSDTDKEWVVVGFDVDILWELDCVFCSSNAASNAVTSIPLQNRKGVDAFNAMFDEMDGKPTRSEMSLKKWYPTNPQAEILVFDKIEPKYMVGAFFETKKLSVEYKKDYPGFKFGVRSNFYSPRADWRNW